jgi:hypothetical protein
LPSTAHGFGALLAQGQVVFAAAAIVGVALDQDLAALVLVQVVRVVGNHWLAIFTHDVAVEVEVDAAVGQHAFWIVQRIDGRGFDWTDVARCRWRLARSGVRSTTVGSATLTGDLQAASRAAVAMMKLHS